MERGKLVDPVFVGLDGELRPGLLAQLGSFFILLRKFSCEAPGGALLPSIGTHGWGVLLRLARHSSQ